MTKTVARTRRSPVHNLELGTNEDELRPVFGAHTAGGCLESDPLETENKL